MLEIHDLSVSYNKIPTVEDISFTVGEGEIVSIIGKSGSGKSTILNAVSGLLGRNGTIRSGTIRFDGKVLYENGKYTPLLRQVRGRQLATITQQPDKSLDPVFTIGNQMTEVMRVNEKISREDARRKGYELLEQLKFSDPERVWRSYPFELSGGMCQRVAIAMALANRATLLLADEPTSALDVTIQAELAKQLREISEEHNMAILLVTHNMDLAKILSHRVGVLQDGHMTISEDTHGAIT